MCVAATKKQGLKSHAGHLDIKPGIERAQGVLLKDGSEEEALNVNKR